MYVKHLAQLAIDGGNDDDGGGGGGGDCDGDDNPQSTPPEYFEEFFQGWSGESPVLALDWIFFPFSILGSFIHTGTYSIIIHWHAGYILVTESNNSFLPLIHKIQHLDIDRLAMRFLSFYSSNAPVTAR